MQIITMVVQDLSASALHPIIDMHFSAKPKLYVLQGYLCDLSFVLFFYSFSLVYIVGY